MGSQLLYGFCKGCGGMYGSNRGKQVFNECKCRKIKPRKQMEEDDFYRIDKILHVGDKKVNCGQQFEYWKKRVNERIEFIKPLIEELKVKKIDLATLSKELHQEWITLIECKEYYEF